MEVECAHPSCTCTGEPSDMLESGGSYFCSDYCAGAGEDDEPCNCGHPDCGG